MTDTPAASSIAVVLPCYRSSGQVLDVLARIPPLVDKIYCVDDACPDGTGKKIESECNDPRVKVLYHDKNRGVGGAVMTGYRAALQNKADIILKIDSDNQMDPALIPSFIAPIIAGQADYTKGNRFYRLDLFQGMPTARILGNAALSFLTKLSTGYWQIFDPTNGYTAIHASVLSLLPFEKISQGYFFESDMLFRLGTVRAVVQDVPQRAVYADEVSQMNIWEIIPTFAGRHCVNFAKRIFYNYFLRDFQVASIEWVLGPILLVFSLVFGFNSWMESIQTDESASAGTVMLAALPMIVGVQMILSALQFDVYNQPRIVLHRLITNPL